MGISIWQLLIILAIVVLLFGTKRLRNIGGDLGSALKSFRSAVKDGEEAKPVEPEKITDNTEQKTAETTEAEKAAGEKEKV